MDVVVRDATEDDVDAIVAVYNEVIATSDAIWREEPVTVADRLDWFRSMSDTGHPVLVADGGAGVGVIGYLSLSEFRPFPGYWPTWEQSIHVAGSARNQGVGEALVRAAISRAVESGKRRLIAGADGHNVGSIRFHQRLGYREVARMPGVGQRFESERDLVLLQLDLDTPDESDESI